MKRRTWREEIYDAFVALGGDAQYKDLYEYLERNVPRYHESKNVKATIRAEIERASSDSDVFNGKEDLFFSVYGKGKGYWGIRNYTPSDKDPVDLTEDDIGFPEGKAALKKHLKHERNASLVKRAKIRFKEEHGHLFCEAGGFSFSDTYQADIANDFIEVHYMAPISELRSDTKTKVSDLVMLCSNCHRMVHRYRPFITNRKDLRKILIR